MTLTLQEPRLPAVDAAEAAARSQEGGHLHLLHLSDRGPHGRHPKGRKELSR